jgi:hypothetical protein
MRPVTRWGIVLATLGTCAFSALVRFQEQARRKDPPPSELFDVIQAGILGLRSQHYQQVYRQVSSSYQERHDFDDFRESARADGVAIRRATRWEFGVPRPDSEGIEVPVHFFLPSSEVFPAKFTLVRENHAWKIQSVQLPVQSIQAKALGGVRL